MNSIDNKYVALLESRVDHLETELSQLDLCGGYKFTPF